MLMMAIAIQGCSNQQASAVGMRKSTVTAYPQNMTNTQLCETLYYSRSSTQTKAAIGSEFNRRGLSRSQCDEQNKKLYLVKAIDEILSKVE
ncbi:hypothetical protein KP803_06420 [Vibrio sp. ZSDE26]|uniref:Uncharacterized protein n=2 Tax=Vibrio amylolyticus TaxID=2847292 RepID=A0A9X2BGI0_9VIBR|nr:hypothetical protein [Vibrio amylolyticus]MCK6262911.1 hypothetical protein [Vibrio amylolyticus]